MTSHPDITMPASDDVRRQRMVRELEQFLSVALASGTANPVLPRPVLRETEGVRVLEIDCAFRAEAPHPNPLPEYWERGPEGDSLYFADSAVPEGSPC
jgi:hypothetical protein